jgi:HKD family nuclease
MSYKVTLVENIYKKNLFEHHIKKLFSSNSKVDIAVAFLKSSGLDLIEKELKAALRRGVKINLIVGLDFGFSEYEALKKLLELFEKYKNANLYFAQGSGGVFHPKLYLFSNKIAATIIAGSPNFTKGGFSENIECSLRVDCLANSKIFKDSLKLFENLLKSKEVFDASSLILEKYKPFQKSQTSIRNRKILQKPNQSDYDELLELNTNKLKDRFNTYINKKENKQNFSKRRRDYREAKKILDKISGIRKISTSEFYPLFASLVGGSGYEQIWHSGGINRGIHHIKTHPKRFQKLIRYIKKNHHKQVDVVFEEAMHLIAKIPLLGINIVTEILVTYDPLKYAIVNNSPVKALRYFGCYTKGKNSFDGYYYLVFCRWMYEIQKILGANSLLEVDGFFNYIYWKIKERERNKS